MSSGFFLPATMNGRGNDNVRIFFAVSSRWMWSISGSGARLARAITTLTRAPVGHHSGIPSMPVTVSRPWIRSGTGILISSNCGAASDIAGMGSLRGPRPSLTTSKRQG